MSASSGPRTPVLLTSLTSAALLDGRGDLELPREMRGTVVDCGGVIGQCVRLTGAWRLDLHCDGLDGTLPASFVDSDRLPGAWQSRHRWNGFELTQKVAALEDAVGVVRTIQCARTSETPASLRVTSSFAPFLLPVLVEGIRPHLFRVTTSAEEVRIRQRGFGLTVRSNLAPAQLFLNRGSWIGGNYRGRVDEVGLEYTFLVAPGTPVELRLLIAGGMERTVEERRDRISAALGDPNAAAAAVATADRTWEASTPTLRFPQAPGLERGYRLAREALRRLYSAPADDMAGLVAGFPWYSALWCRDLAWMLWAVLWLGDYDWAKRSVDTVLRFQSRESIPILGSEAGELPMQISPGPIFFYGTSDTTLYYPLLMTRLARHAGLSSLPDGWRDGIRRMIAWGEARTDVGSGLLRNGGEAEEISAATSSLARVRYGIDSPDTTIWDSTDRRDHAIDIQVLWWRALRVASEEFGDRPDESSGRWREMAERVAATIRARYVWPDEGYLYDSLRDGQPVAQVRPNALRAVSAGLFRGDDARRLVTRVARDDLTTPWGVRTLSTGDPSYRPAAYHDGQVWTIATAWAADAALAAGDLDRGVAYLTTIAERYDREAGFANECYRGDRDEPFDSCFLLGFSVAPFLTTLFERLWGLTLDARANRLTVRPAFPAAWRSASIDNLRIGTGTASLDWSPERLRVRWFGPGTLSVDGGAGVAAVPSGASSDVTLGARP